MEDTKSDDTNLPEEGTGGAASTHDEDALAAGVEPVAPEPAEEAAPAEAPAEESSSDTGYQFDDDLSDIEPSTPAAKAPAAPSTGGGGGGGRGDSRYADEVFSKTIHAKFRTFYVDVKESSNGKFLKVSEKSRGRKSTVMMDAEDVPEMIQALQEAQKHL